MAAYQRLFADVAEDTDPHSRFRVRLTVLEEEARELVVLNHTGDVFYEPGGLEPAYGSPGLARPERRELVANMYLRRGLLESVGDEWVAAVRAVCSTRWLKRVDLLPIKFLPAPPNRPGKAAAWSRPP